eukprot:TRINITY_DN54867_c0_g1_i1.p1 TRINITY_DN54867_c0_g1~~TRINITY_DN54867_c0_g1_i1.p1  ORF type:complete len:1036 (-),score=121.37 TRINITY_DN54867_c0_g1_i1:41-3148(-)
MAETSEVDLGDLISFQIDYGKIQFIFQSVLDEVRKNKQLIERLQVEKKILKERTDEQAKDIQRIFDALEKKADKDALVPLTTRLYNLEARAVPDHLDERLQALEEQVSQNQYDDTLFDDFMADHERRLHNLEEDAPEDLAREDSKKTGTPPSTPPSGKKKSSEGTPAGSGHAAASGKTSRQGSTSSVKDSARRSSGASEKSEVLEVSPLDLGGIGTETQSTGQSSGKSSKKESPKTAGGSSKSLDKTKSAASAGRGTTKSSARATGSAYDTIGASTGAATMGERMMRSGLSERLRGLMDDHERRLKLLEKVGPRTALPLSVPAMQPSSSAYDGMLNTQGLGTLQEMCKGNATAIKSLTVKLMDLDSMIINMGEGSGNAAMDATAAKLTGARIQELQHKVQLIQSQLDSSASDSAFKALESKVGEIQTLTTDLETDVDKVKKSIRSNESSSDAVARLQNELKMFALRLGSLEDISNAQIAGGAGASVAGKGHGGPVNADVLTIKFKGIQDAVDMLVKGQGTLEEAQANVTHRMDDVDSQSSDMQKKINGLINDVRERLAEGITHAAFTSAMKEIRDTLSSLENRLRREEQNIKLMNTKVNTLSARAADTSLPSTPSRTASMLSKQFLEKSMGQANSADINELRSAISTLAQVVDDHSSQIQLVSDDKADKGSIHEVYRNINELTERLNMLNDRFTATSKAMMSGGGGGDSGGGSGKPNTRARLTDTAMQDLHELRVLVQSHASSIDRLFADKANRETIVQHARQLDELRKALGVRGKLGGLKGGVDADYVQDLAGMINEHSEQLDKMREGKADKDTTNDRFFNMGEGIENLNLNKADATAVASKAERDYVENALEKLRREVEQVMNNTNNGLIDTLDKSLNILRDMIDGKANVADMLKLREAVLHDKKEDETPEGLAGYKQFRCLSCNRKMEGMRARPQGMNFMNFMTHLPNPRTKALYQAQAQTRRIASANSSSQTRNLHSAPAGGRQEQILPPVDGVQSPEPKGLLTDAAGEPAGPSSPGAAATPTPPMAAAQQ